MVTESVLRNTHACRAAHYGSSGLSEQSVRDAGPPGLHCRLMGSYQRGAPDSADADFIITPPALCEDVEVSCTHLTGYDVEVGGVGAQICNLG